MIASTSLLLWVLAAQPRTLRVDYFHTGNATEEHFSLGDIVLEPLPFPGNPDRPIDDTNLGKYLFEVRDRATNTLLYSRGFSSIYGEWETTPEAKLQTRTFQESLRFPQPSAPAQVILKKRDAQNAFREVASFLVDPRDMFIQTASPPSPGQVYTLMNNGPSEHKVDLLILGDGYTREQRPKFLADAKRFMGFLFKYEPFRRHRQDFNVWAICPASQEAGISRPSLGVHRWSPLGTRYDAFGSERYILTFDNRDFRDVASFAPYDVVEILTNSKTYGGGGIFNLYSTVAADSTWAPYIFVHEFGHHLAGLADEYFTSDTAYTPAQDRPEPWEPNVTALHDPQHLKWADLVTPGTPIPTPWRKEEFESHSRAAQQLRHQIRQRNQPETSMDQLFQKEKGQESQLLSTDRYSGHAGAFEGANYESQGYYRPAEDCVMFSRDEVPFCPVCQRAIERVIALDTEGPASR